MVLVIFIKMHVNFNTFGAAYDISLLTAFAINHALYGRIQRGGGGGGGRESEHPFPLENRKDIVILAILVRIPSKVTELPRQHSITGHRWPASETPFKWPVMASAFSGIWIISPALLSKEHFQS